MSKKLELTNYYETIPKKYLGKKRANPNFKLHGINLPFRMIILGASGAGKSNTCLNIIKFVGNFDKIHLVCKNKDEPLYNYLTDISKKNGFDLTISEGIETIPEMNTFDKNDNNLVVFDDMIVEKNQSAIEEFYIRCRKLGISSIYLSQSWYAIPKKVRQNANYLIIKKIGSARDIKMMMKEYSFGIEPDELIELYNFCVHGNFNNFLMIDVDAQQERKFRKNFDILTINFDE